jgi:pimeloyl-ACP methyl ester carboxylesterase
MPSIDLDDVRLHYQDTHAGTAHAHTATAGGGARGSGRPELAALLLAHGWGGSAEVWAPLDFAGRRVVAVDLRGHGRSSVPAAGYRPSDLAWDLAQLVRRLGLGRVVAVGHSMGAQVVTALAVEWLEVVEAVVVIDPAYGADDGEARGFGERLRALRAEGAVAAVRMLGALPAEVREQLLATPGHVLAACYAGMYTEPGAFGAMGAAERYLRRRTRPVLCLRSLAGPAAWEAGLPAPPGSRVVVWPGTGHFLHLERPAATARLIRDWLSAPPVRHSTGPG